jgi:hypothetical protein
MTGDAPLLKPAGVSLVHAGSFAEKAPEFFKGVSGHDTACEVRDGI